MIAVAKITEMDTEELMEARDTLASDGGAILIGMMNQGMNVAMNKIMSSEEGANRERGRCDVYAGFVKLRGQIADELAQRQKKKVDSD